MLSPDEQRQGSILSAEQELSEIFGSLGYKPFSMLPTDDTVVTADSSLYLFKPYIKNNQNIEIETRLGLDYDTGNIFIVSSVYKYAGAHSKGMLYIVKDCGKKLDDALQIAQDLYNTTFAQFKTTEDREKTKYVLRLYGDPLSSDHIPQVFLEDKENIISRLTEEVKKMETYQEQQEEKKESREHITELGYI